jgi:hypothetical protein
VEDLQELGLGVWGPALLLSAKQLFEAAAEGGKAKG